jgi:CheY-like chemotaxis protein
VCREFHRNRQGRFRKYRPEEELPLNRKLNEGALVTRPCLVLGHADPVYAAQVRRAFARLHWDVQVARSGPEARFLAQRLEPALVVLDADLSGESGWLTCDKLTRERADLKVVLVSDRPDSASYRFAYFVRAKALVPREDGIKALLAEAAATPLPAAG